MQLSVLEKANFKLFCKIHYTLLKSIYTNIFAKYQDSISFNEFLSFAFYNSSFNEREYKQKLYY